MSASQSGKWTSTTTSSVDQSGSVSSVLPNVLTPSAGSVGVENEDKYKMEENSVRLKDDGPTLSLFIVVSVGEREPVSPL
jgi:hypothetical protein